MLMRCYEMLNVVKRAMGFLESALKTQRPCLLGLQFQARDRII